MSLRNTFLIVWKATVISLICSMGYSDEVSILKCEILEEVSRAKKGYTQGFYIEDGVLYESTGGYGSSLIRSMDLKTQQVKVSKPLPNHLFAEGLAPYGEDAMIQLTWKAGLGIIYDRESINVRKVFKYSTEGWGIATKGTKVVMSDGSDSLTFLDPQTLTPVRQLKVTLEGQPVERLNELEWVEDTIWANVWMTDVIVGISPETGKVLAKVDCANLLEGKRPRDRNAVLNGIAYDSEEKVFWLTGKRWPTMYKVRFQPIDSKEE